LPQPNAGLSHGRRALGKSGLTVAPLAWGMWRFKGTDVKAARTLVETALATGMDLLDTADIYGPDNGEPFGAAEELLGKVLAEAPGLRDRFVLATKGGIQMGTPYNSSADYLTSAVEASLKRMGVERIELWQIHRPDHLAHPAEIARTFEALRASGKVAEFGVSNHTAAQVAALSAHLPFPLVSTQPEFSPLCIDPLYDGVLDQALEKNLAVLAWSPLGGGRIAFPTDDRAHAVVAELTKVAERAGVSVTAAAYGWIMAHPTGAIPIVGVLAGEVPVIGLPRVHEEVADLTVPPELAAALAAVAVEAADAVGAQLVTVSLWRPESADLVRVYSSRPHVYQLGGISAELDDAWIEQCLVGQRSFLAAGEVAFTAETAEHVGVLTVPNLTAAVNAVIVDAEGVLGCLNFLDAAGVYSEVSVEVADVFAARLAPVLRSLAAA